MLFTVALCTWNRCASLRSALERLTQLDTVDFEWELVVIDNASTDNTSAVLAEAPSTLPLRTEREPHLGIAHARNRAVGTARGRWILWLDDDVLVDPGWLRAYGRAVRRWPEAAFFGGPIEPRFEGEPPPWLSANLSRLAGVYAMRDLGPAPIELDRFHVPWGPNMAVRADVERQVPYDPQLGLAGRDRIGGVETDHLRQIVDLGHRGWWVPEARVQHVIGANRLTVSHVRRYFEGLGRSIGLKHGAGLPESWFRALAFERRYRNSLASGAASEAWMPLLIEASLARGECRAHRDGRGAVRAGEAGWHD